MQSGECASGVRGGNAELGSDFDRSADGDEVPDFVHLGIGNGDAAESPVIGAVRCAVTEHILARHVRRDDETHAARDCHDSVHTPPFSFVRSTDLCRHTASRAGIATD